jgi:hypothetical protein
MLPCIYLPQSFSKDAIGAPDSIVTKSLAASGISTRVLGKADHADVSDQRCTAQNRTTPIVPALNVWSRLSRCHQCRLGAGAGAAIAIRVGSWRQWQFEFQGEDAGTPIDVRVEGEIATLGRSRGPLDPTAATRAVDASRRKFHWRCKWSVSRRARHARFAIDAGARLRMLRTSGLIAAASVSIRVSRRLPRRATGHRRGRERVARTIDVGRSGRPRARRRSGAVESRGRKLDWRSRARHTRGRGRADRTHARRVVAGVVHERPLRRSDGRVVESRAAGIRGVGVGAVLDRRDCIDRR